MKGSGKQGGQFEAVNSQTRGFTMRTILLSVLAIGALGLSACSALPIEKFEVRHGNSIVGSVTVQDISQEKMDIEFRAANGKLQRILHCDKFDGVCFE